MAVTLYNPNSEAGLKKLDEYLISRSYITGYQASKDDLTVYAAVGKAPADEYVNVLRWFKHIDALLRISGVSGDGSGVTVEGSAPASEVATPPAADSKASAANDDDDDMDLFGDETEEEKAAAEKLAAAKKKPTKKASGKSSVLLDVKPWDDETDMKKLEEAVRSVKLDGLFWGASKLVAVGYGIKKLQIMLTIVDDLVSVDDMVEDYLTAEPINETPFTTSNLEGKQEHHSNNVSNQSYRAKVAFQKKNAEGKDVAARNFIKQLRQEFGEGTMCLVYNATGDTVMLCHNIYWEGHACESPCPSVISNGQWGAFLIAPNTENNATSAAFIYEGGNSVGTQYQWLTAFTTSPGTTIKYGKRFNQQLACFKRMQINGKL